MGDDTEPIEDDELLYRRVQLDYFDPDHVKAPHPDAFRARPYDDTGISLFRAKFITPEEVAQNDRGKQYYVAVLRAGDLRANGLEAVPKPHKDRAGHSELPDLTHENRKDDAAEEARRLLAQKLSLEILGPFPESA